MRFVASMTAAAMLGGCAWPVVPSFDIKEQANGTKAVYQLDPYEARSLLVNWEHVLESAARNRRTAELVMEELTFYGTLVFTAALAQISHGGGTAQVSKSVLRARNIGAGAAGGSQLLTSHYRWADQRVAFMAAASRLRCAREAIAPLNPAVRELMTDVYIASVNMELKNAGSHHNFEELWTNVPNVTAQFVEEQVNPELQAALQSISLSTPSRTELATLIDNWKQANQTGGKAAGNAADTKTALVSRVAELKSASKVPRTAVAEDDGRVPEERATQQRKEDRAVLEGKNEVELQDMRKAFVVALVAYGSSLSLCK